MDAQSDNGPLPALLRMIAVRLPGIEAGIYASDGGRLRLASATPGFPRGPGASAPAAAAAGEARLAHPAEFELPDVGFCAVQPVAGDDALGGCLVLVDRRRRRLSPALTRALADAARIAGPLIAAPPPLTRRAGLARELAEASGRGEMRLVYQRYIDLADGRTSGAEALMRWRHPRWGEVMPIDFIPLAESTGLILPLGAWALRTALDAAARWPRRLKVSVNVSALQFHQPRFVEEVDAALKASGVAARRLELEITETVLMRDNPSTNAQLEALVDRGVRIALDDFGTGYSALAYLGRLPHHRIKLDRSFIQDLGNPGTRDLVEAIIALARKNRISTTAEGVETVQQLHLVRALGFTHAQGFANGPMIEDPARMLEEIGGELTPPAAVVSSSPA